MKELCSPYTLLIEAIPDAAGMYPAPSSTAMPAQQSGPTTTPSHEPPAEVASTWDAGMSRLDKVALASQMTQQNKKSRVMHMELVCAKQGLEIVEAQLKAVRSPEEVKNLMESNQVSALMQMMGVC